MGGIVSVTGQLYRTSVPAKGIKQQFGLRGAHCYSSTGGKGDEIRRWQDTGGSRRRLILPVETL